MLIFIYRGMPIPHCEAMTNNGNEVKYTAKYVSRLEAIIEGQASVLEMISRNVSIQEVLEGIIVWVESHSDGEVLSSILLADKEAKTLLHGAGPSLPDFYNQAVHGLHIAYGEGSCGTAAFIRQQPSGNQHYPISIQKHRAGFAPHTLAVSRQATAGS